MSAVSMVAGASPAARLLVRRRAARAWAFRWSVEIIAERAFAGIARELALLGYPEELAEAAASASEDEGRHVLLCAKLATDFGAVAPAWIPPRVELAPSSLSREDALVYEIVARCCVAETESTATLLELLDGTTGEVHEVVHEIARDEVQHARLGWRFLAHASGQRDLAWLGPHLPAMLATGGAPLFVAPSAPDASAVALGTLTLHDQRRLFVEALEEVVFPGLDLYGVPTAEARAWLADQQARLLRTGG